MEATASFLRDEKGQISGILVVSRDITRRKTAETEKQRLEAKLQQAYKMEAVGTLAGGIHARGRAGRREYWWFQLFGWAIPAGLSSATDRNITEFAAGIRHTF